MEIKLNKELQKKLDDFLETKDAKMQEFLEILDLNEFTFSQDEINQVEKIYKEWMNEYYDSFQQDVFLYKNGEYILSSGFIKFVYKKVNSQIDI